MPKFSLSLFIVRIICISVHPFIWLFLQFFVIIFLTGLYVHAYFIPSLRQGNPRDRRYAEELTIVCDGEQVRL